MSEPAGRECGECIACCVYLDVNLPDFRKPPLTHCEHLCLTNPIEPGVLQYSTDEPKACGIHGMPERHEVCDAYKCLWRLGYGAEQDRPDRCGMLMDTLRKIDNAIECKALWEGAEDDGRAIGAVQRMCRSTQRVAIVTCFPERRIVRAVGRPL